MKAEVVSMKADKLDMEAIRRGGDILKQGGLVAFPTEPRRYTVSLPQSVSTGIPKPA